MKKLLTLILVSSGFLASNAYACTTITHNFESLGVYSARTMDFCQDLHSSLNVYPRGIIQNGMMKDKNSLAWTSKYGYVSVNEPSINTLVSSEGLNEKGLGAHVLYLGGTKQPVRDISKPGVNAFVWIHYILGNYVTVQQVVDGLKNYQIYNYPAKIDGAETVIPMHFAVEDASGDSAVIEFIAGKMKLYHGKEYDVMTNEPSYDKQIENLLKIQKTPYYNDNVLPGGADPANRFVRAYYANSNLPQHAESTNAVSYMFSAISSTYVPYFNNYTACGFGAAANDKNVADAWPTQWVTVFDYNNKTLYFSSMTVGNRIWVDLNELNLDKGQPLRSIDPTKLISISGDVSKLLR